jgi:hypothetical protein
METKCNRQQQDKGKLNRHMRRLEEKLEEEKNKNQSLLVELAEVKESHELDMERELKFRNAITDAHAKQVCHK